MSVRYPPDFDLFSVPPLTLLRTDGVRHTWMLECASRWADLWCLVELSSLRMGKVRYRGRAPTSSPALGGPGTWARSELCAFVTSQKGRSREARFSSCSAPAKQRLNPQYLTRRAPPPRLNRPNRPYPCRRDLSHSNKRVASGPSIA